MKTCHRLSAAVLTWTLAGLLAPVPLANLAYAASTVISDVPLAAAKRPNPNMIMAIDDSGSMDSEVGFNANDGAVWWRYDKGRFFGLDPTDADKCTASATKAWGCTTAQTVNYNGVPGAASLDGSGNILPPMIWGKYFYLFPNGNCGQSATAGDFPGFPAARVTPAYPCDTRTYGDDFKNMAWYWGSPTNVFRAYTVAPTQQFAWARSPLYNGLYYNPATTYVPWKPYYDGTSNCPSGTYSSTTLVCTPGNASISSTLSHPYYGSSTSQSNMNLFALLATPTDGGSPAKPLFNYIFRMYPGMIVPTGASYRLCTTVANPSNKSASVTNSCAASWTGPTAKNLCLVNGTITSCASHMGMTVGTTGTDKIDLISGGKDHADVSIPYVPGTYWTTNSTVCGTTISPNATNIGNGTCAWGPDGQLIAKVDLSLSTPTTFTVASTRTDCAGGTTCTLAEERQNFANWFQYYRKRHLMLNAALGNAFDGLRGLRAGFFVFNDVGNSPSVNMFDFDASTGTAPSTVADPTKNSTALFGQLIQNTADGATPTRQSLDWTYTQYKRTNAGAPITNYCQFNAAFVITDGFASTTYDSSKTGNTVLPTNYGNYDGQTPSATYLYNKQYSTTGATITAPYADNVSNTLADIAMKMYTENPRPDLTPTGGVPVDKSDVSPGADRNPNLHVNTYGMILGLNGTIFAATSSPTLTPAQLTNQNNDPYTYNPDWNSMGDVTSINGSPKAIDELWHATINGRGQMLLANSPEQTRDAVLTIVSNVVSKGGAAAAVAVSNPNPVAGDNFAYASNYNSGAWSGDINAYQLDLTTGQPGTTSLWNPSPQHLLAGRDYTTRVIATYNGTAGVPFQWSSLSSTQQGQLGTSVTGPNVLAFLRGARNNEGITFRGRGPRAPYPNGVVSDNVAVLGDIVNAEPIYIGAPRFSYMDSGYTAFKTGTAATRTKTVYQGANDGMLHAFDATNGTETWAYIPNAVFPNLLNLSSKNAFVHKFYVDGTPVYGDADFSNTSGSGTTTADWHTILVGAYAKGGRGYYALDVTTPTMAGESGLASKVLWEFPNAATLPADNANLGNSFGRAILVKTRAAGWVVLAASGYNNNTVVSGSTGDGKGHLFVLNAKNGTKIADLSTTNGSTATPSGLAYISAWVDHANTDNTVETVYGGDLTGSLWRFDLSGTTTASWAVQLVTKLVDASGTAQPVTTEPELGVVSGYRMIYVGTGQYLGAPDIPLATGANASATSTQTMYALKEPKPYAATASPLTTALITTLRGTLVAQVATNPTSTTASVTSNLVNLASKNGWYIDLPHVGERVVTNPALGQGVLGFTTNIPDGTDPCLPGGSSWLYNVSYSTGGYIANSNATAGIAGKSLGNALASRPQFIQLEGDGTPGSAKTVELIRLSNDTTVPADVPPASSGVGGKRKSWREINVQ